jgi:hypothetical protein
MGATNAEKERMVVEGEREKTAFWNAVGISSM